LWSNPASMTSRVARRISAATDRLVIGRRRLNGPPFTGTGQKHTRRWGAAFERRHRRATCGDLATTELHACRNPQSGVDNTCDTKSATSCRIHLTAIRQTVGPRMACALWRQRKRYTETRSAPSAYSICRSGSETAVVHRTMCDIV
jgi:hypothetical protein